MKILDLLDKGVSKILKWLLSFSLLLMTAILIGNSIARNLGGSWSFSEEIGRFVLIIVTFTGTAIAVRTGQHISMSAVVDALSPKLKLIFMLVINLFTGLLFLFLLYSSWRYVHNLYNINMVSPALRVPFYTVYSIVPFTMFISALECFKNMVANIQGRILFSDTERLPLKKEEGVK